MRILPAVEEEIRRVVRDARANDPLIHVAGLKDVLETHFDRGFPHQYVSKMADKVAREGLMEADLWDATDCYGREDGAAAEWIDLGDTSAPFAQNSTPAKVTLDAMNAAIET